MKTSISATGDNTRVYNVMRTPNPQALVFFLEHEGPSRKELFLPSSGFVARRAVARAQSGEEGPYAALFDKLFDRDCAAVSEALVRSDQITVVLGEEEDWDDETEAEVKAEIDAFFTNEYTDADNGAMFEGDNDDDDEGDSSSTVEEIKLLLEKHVRPTLQADGGDVVFLGYTPETGTVRVSLVGSCSSCERSTITIRFMIANLLCHYLPDEVKEVVPESLGA